LTNHFKFFIGLACKDLFITAAHKLFDWHF